MPEKIIKINKLLRSSPLFAGISEDALSSLAQEMELSNIKGGDTLIKQGDTGDCLYILAHGRMLVYHSSGGDKPIGEIGVGDIVGELALLIDTPRTATVRAVRDCTLVKISRTVFEKIVKEHPSSAMKIVSACVNRFLPHHSEKKHHIKTIVLVPCQAAVETEAVAEKLQIALSKYLDTNLVTSQQENIKKLLEKSTALIQDELNEEEEKHDITLYIADKELSAWSERCIRQADKIVLISMADSVINSEIEEYVNEQENIIAERILLVLHKEHIKLPQDTRELIAKNPSDMHFHVATLKDYERVARFLVGKAVCVVFSGGGLRGVAHHGLVRAFEERGIPIDMTGGTSFGSILAMATAMGLNHEEMLDLWKNLVQKINKVVDLTLPMTSISAGKTLYKLLTETFPENIDIEDLWLPSFCVATDLTDFDLCAIKDGPVWRAVRASMSIPGIFPPVIRDGRVLVDGASFNNLPVDLMRLANNDGTIIASVASSLPIRQEFANFDLGVSGWRLLFNSMMGRKTQALPGIADVLVNTSLAASTRHQLQMQSQADFTFDLNVDEFKLLDVKNWEKIKDRGYESVCKALDEQGITRESLGL